MLLDWYVTNPCCFKNFYLKPWALTELIFLSTSLFIFMNELPSMKASAWIQSSPVKDSSQFSGDISDMHNANMLPCCLLNLLPLCCIVKKWFCLLNLFVFFVFQVKFVWGITSEFLLWFTCMHLHRQYCIFRNVPKGNYGISFNFSCILITGGHNNFTLATADMENQERRFKNLHN